jgi:hypothetical protein
MLYDPSLLIRHVVALIMGTNDITPAYLMQSPLSGFLPFCLSDDSLLRYAPLCRCFSSLDFDLLPVEKCQIPGTVQF